jgi:hypothetical protein
MAIIRSLPALPSSPAPLDTPVATAPRHHLRAVDRDEVIDVAEFLPPGATWLPAPAHTLPTLPGQPPMVGYLVLIPADSPHLVRTGHPVTPLPDEAAEPLVRIDTVQRTAQLNGAELDLTYLEFELLAHLVAHPNRVHTRDQLVTTVWGYGHVGDGRTVDVHIARLRRKLGVEHRKAIQTVRRVGYKYTPPTAR